MKRKSATAFQHTDWLSSHDDCENAYVLRHHFVLQGDILEDIALIENLEETKRTAVDIAEKVKQAKETEVSIGRAREVYRPVATRGSLVYFLIDTLNALDRCYHYSMANFVYILRKGGCLLLM